tara:strand:- start:236 stop:1123 length:888 start_codon:yes stop_codon:yes gene_type:complete
LLLNKIIIGTAQNNIKYGIVREKSTYKLHNILNQCHELGISYIDTSNHYSNAHQLISTYKNLDNFNIITKLSLKNFNFENLENNSIDLEFEEIFKTLNHTKIYCLMIHDTSILRSKFSKYIMQVFKELKQKKKIKKIGLSIYGPNDLNEFYDYDFDIIQGPFSVFDQRLKKTGWLKKINNDNKQFHARSIFLQGLLLQNSLDNLPVKFHVWKKIWLKWITWHNKNNLNPLQSCLSFVFGEKLVSNVVIGIDNGFQLSKIFDCIEKELIDENLLKELEKININDEKLINPKNWKFI